MSYHITEVDPSHPIAAEAIHAFNAMDPAFPSLMARHFTAGFWWLVYFEGAPVGFAGLTPMVPFANVGYLKRAYVLPAHRGHGLQRRLLSIREDKARRLGWNLLVSECAADNRWSADNFAKARYTAFEPEQKWGAADSIYWKKEIR